MRLRELAPGQRRYTTVVLAVDGVLALAEAPRGEAHCSAVGHYLSWAGLPYRDATHDLSASALSKAVRPEASGSLAQVESGTLAFALAYHTRLRTRIAAAMGLDKT